MRIRKRSMLAFLLTVCAAAAAVSVGASSPAAAAGSAEYVSPSGSPSNAGFGCASATFVTISAAVAAAPSGGKVVACPGTYHEDVLVQKPLQLYGYGATINADGLENAMQIVASDVKVRGFRLIDANGEGLLVGID